jgi:uncharacterized protein DUF3141
MSSTQTQSSSTAEFTPPLGIFAPAMNYLIDAAQRSVLFWDVMRQRGNQYREHLAETAPHVLEFEVELLIDGRTLNHPANYALAVRESAASRPTAKSASHSRPVIRATSLASCPIRFPAKPSRTSRAPRRFFWRKSRLCIPRLTASPA